MSKPDPKPRLSERALTEIGKVIALDSETNALLREIADYLKRIADKVDPK